MHREYKAVMLGSGGVGKSALTVKFVTGQFAERYDPTVEDFYRKEIEVEGAPATLEILDTAGTEQFASMRDLYIRNGQGFILVFSISSRQTFTDIKSMRNQICRVKATEKVPIILVGNKSDLDHERQVSYSDAQALAKQWGGVPFFEASAKQSRNVDELFTAAVAEMNRVGKKFKSDNRTKPCCFM